VGKEKIGLKELAILEVVTVRLQAGGARHRAPKDLAPVCAVIAFSGKSIDDEDLCW
jgi:hypothetical protein